MNQIKVLFKVMMPIVLVLFIGCKNKQIKRMNKEVFWSIIEKTKNSDTEIMRSNLVKELKHFSKEDVLLFNSFLGGYLELVNETIWLDMACKVINGYVSDDTGLYFTLWMIAQGETVLLRALSDPDSLSELPEIPFGDASFERLVTVGMNLDEDAEIDIELMEQSRNSVMAEIAPTVKFKNNEQLGGYEEFEDAMKDIPNVLPRLIKRAEREGFDWNN